MSLSRVSYVAGAAQTDFTITFDYISEDYVEVWIDGVLQTVTTHYTFFTASVIRLVTPAAGGEVVQLKRNTKKDARLVDFQDAGNLTEADLDLSADQVFHLQQENVDDTVDYALQLDTDDKWDAESKVMKNLADPVNAQDAATKNWSETSMTSSVGAAAASAAAALVSENNAAASEALTDADAIATAADAVATAADAAATAADLVNTNQDTIDTAANLVLTNIDVVLTHADVVLTNADVVSADAAKTAAEAAQVAAEVAADEVDDFMLGWKASDPVVDNDGDPLITGASYWNTTISALKIWDGAAWQLASVSPASHYTKGEVDAMLPRRNLLKNGNLSIWQRGESFTGLTTGTTYTADMWVWAAGTTTGGVDLTRAAVTTIPYIDSCIQVDVTTADVSISAGSIAEVRHAVEGYDMVPANWAGAAAGRSDITISFYSSHTVTGTHCVAVRNEAADRSYIAEYTQAVANTWERQEITIPAPTSGTWDQDNTVGMYLSFTVVAGTTFQGTVDTWNTGNYIGTASQSNNLSSTSNFFRIAAVQVELGDTASPLEIRPRAEELALCQRYYEHSFNDGVVPAQSVSGAGAGIGIAGSTADIYANEISFKVTKRTATPALTFYRSSNSVSDSRWAYYTASPGWSTPSANTGYYVRNEHGFTPHLASVSATAGFGYVIEGNWAADCSL